MTKRKPSFTPATEFKVTKLRPSGPKPGQSTRSYMYGRKLGDDEWQRMANQFNETGEKQITELTRKRRLQNSRRKSSTEPNQ